MQKALYRFALLQHQNGGTHQRLDTRSVNNVHGSISIRSIPVSAATAEINKSATSESSFEKTEFAEFPLTEEGVETSLELSPQDLVIVVLVFFGPKFIAEEDLELTDSGINLKD